MYLDKAPLEHLTNNEQTAVLEAIDIVLELITNKCVHASPAEKMDLESAREKII